jgi:hypothetical protein
MIQPDKVNGMSFEDVMTLFLKKQDSLSVKVFSQKDGLQIERSLMIKFQELCKWRCKNFPKSYSAKVYGHYGDMYLEDLIRYNTKMQRKRHQWELDNKYREQYGIAKYLIPRRNRKLFR